MEEHKTCSFIGHRKIQASQATKQKIKSIIEKLIINHNVRIFLFGSRSEFNNLCHLIVTELKEKHQGIKRVSYTCKSETCILESEREKWEKVCSRFQKREVHLLGFEEELEHKNKYSAGKASYVERNQAMIHNSDYCIFYYDENYNPPMRKKYKHDLFLYQPKSGTKIAYEYAKQMRKIIINVALL